MKYVSALIKPEEITLQWMARQHPLQWTRIRAQAVLLSSNGCSLDTLSCTFGICRQTISIWLDNWEREGLCGLIDKPGRGRHKKIILEKEQEVIELITKSPRSLKTVLQEIHKLCGVEISLSTLKRICRKAGLIWKRVKKSLRGKRNDEEFYAALDQIKALLEQAGNGEIDFYYFDESGFSLEPCIPYAWQPVGKTIEVPSSKSKRLNVLGFLDSQCNFESYVFEGSITSDVVIACFDSFAKGLTKKTVVLIDNAPMHTSNAFESKIADWALQGLNIQNIPAYSPELNKIEILWRKIKYEWLDFSAYLSFETLTTNISRQFKVNVSFPAQPTC